MGSKCSHYNLSMKSAVLSGDRLVCPFHAACFNVTTGDIEDGPCFDKLPVFPTRVAEDGRIFVTLPAATKESDKLPTREVPRYCPADSGDLRQFVILGSGPAAQAAVETLRTEGFGGQIVVVSREKYAPYDRTKLSKNLSTSAEGAALRPASFFRERGVTFKGGPEFTVIDVDTRAKTVALANGETLHYTKLLCATGGTARTFRLDRGEGFSIAGAELRNIFVLRESPDNTDLNAALDALVAKRRAERTEGVGCAAAAGSAGPTSVNVVVVGSSFIGMEAAAFLATSLPKGPDGLDGLTVIGMETEPFERVLGAEFGRVMRRLHESKGVDFCMGATVLGFEGRRAGPREGSISGVRVRVGGAEHVIPADVVVIGAGIIPSVKYLQSSAKHGVRVGENPMNGVEVDAFLRATEDVYVAGDIARFPYKYAVDAASAVVRIEHWDVAIDHGRIAARNMMGKAVEYEAVPFFWTGQYGQSIRAAGHARTVNRVIFQGSLEGDRPKFTAYLLTNVNGAEQVRRKGWMDGRSMCLCLCVVWRVELRL